MLIVAGFPSRLSRCMFSNHSAPLNIEDGDRRYFVFNSKAQPREDAYYDRLYEYTEKAEAMNASIRS